jgi:diguanylate cyclase (GGDEF)-like protein
MVYNSIMERKIEVFPPSQPNRTIYLLEQNSSSARTISSQISFFGYEVVIIPNADMLVDRIKSQRPAAVLILIPSSDEAETRYAEIAMLQAEVGPNFPILVVSETGDLSSRLQAVRAGASGYFIMPVDAASLVESLDRLGNPNSPQPFHILVVEDSLTQASLFAMQLKRAGMETRIVSDPTQIISHLQDFNPDLILMDMYMPGCTGIELSQVIRQMEKFVSVPIVYLSAETDKDRQLEAMEQGADDFLTKPIKPGHLTSAVTSRVERYRRLRSYMTVDGLTALLNHTTIKENLGRELLRARRESTPLCFAMLDLDRFKLVNDQFGHAMGDRVLKSLGRLLRQRLRRTDIIGRYGGEEFAVILPNTTPEAAVRLMDELRRNFSEILHRSDEAGFSVTYSCGISSSPPYTELADLSSAADRALYTAKREGRNRVYLSTGVTAELSPEALPKP